MDATKATAKTAAAEAQARRRPTPAADERARARAYLDLWERHARACGGARPARRPPAARTTAGVMAAPRRTASASPAR